MFWRTVAAIARRKEYAAGRIGRPSRHKGIVRLGYRECQKGALPRSNLYVGRRLGRIPEKNVLESMKARCIDPIGPTRWKIGAKVVQVVPPTSPSGLVENHECEPIGLLFCLSHLRPG